MKSYSRRELYALGEPLGDSATYRKADGGLILGGGGSSGPSQTTSTSYQTNIPEYARPYVETMLGATQKQLFQGESTGDGGFNITGFQPYKAYGGSYDAQGNQTSYDPSKAIAGFSPLQRQAQQGIGNLQTPGQFNQAMMGTANAGMGGFGVANQATTGGFQNQVGGYMNPYLDMALQPALQEAQRQYGITGTQQQSAATQAGAFGGSREAIMAAENERNKNTAMNQIIGQGYNQAFQGAQQQYNQNMQNQLAGYGLAGQQAGQLAGIAGQKLGAEQSIYGAQNQAGAQQQAQQQQIINQSMQDYANAQQYPLMQLGTMSNMIRGLPMQAQTTNQYAAAPNQLTQGIGAAGATASLYNATKAEGGVIKSMALGGIASVPRYDVGGEVFADLQKMSPEQLKEQIEKSSSPSVKNMARKLLAMEQPTRAAAGGIMHYAKGDEVDLSAYGKGSLQDRINAASTSAANGVNSEGQNVTMVGGVNPETGIKGYEQPGLLGAKAPVLPNAAVKATPDMLVGGIKGVPAPPAMKEDLFYNSLLAEQATAKARGEKSVSDFAEEVRAAKKAAGIDDQAQQTLRGQEMGRKANLADEARRQKDMRLAEFFASWGSTPGPTLVAGMSALKKSIPDMIGDAKEAKRLERESDKIIYDIDAAIRAEKIGDIDKATALKEKAATHAAELNKIIATYKAHADATAGHIYGSQLKFVGDRETAKSTAANTAELRRGSEEAKAFNQSTILKREVADVQKDIAEEKAKANGEYGKLVNKIDLYSQMTNRTPDQDVVLDKAQARKDALDVAYQTRINIAENNAKVATQRYLNMSGYKGSGEATTAAPAAPAAAPAVTPPEGLPTGSKLVGKDKKTGADVYEAPDGKRYVGS